MTAILREQLLAGRRIALTPSGATPELAVRLTELGASVGLDAPSALLHDTRPTFADGGLTALRAATDEAWAAIHDRAAGAMIPGGEGGPVILVGPHLQQGPLANALRAALENLARTLSVEWARYGINTVALLPRGPLAHAELAELAAFLLSPAAAYLSGCTVEPG